MKLHFICLSSFILLFSGCSRNGFVIKKRYSKGFYIAHASKIRTEQITLPQLKVAQTTVKSLTVVSQDKTLCQNSVAGNNFSVPSKRSIKPLNVITQQHTKTHSSFKKNSSRKKLSYSNSSKTKETVVASVGMLVVLITILALVKTFGLLFIVPVCFVITFTAVAIFFMIRDHVKN